MMAFNRLYVHWKSLTIAGFVFWLLLWYLDLLGESSWKRHSEHVNDLLITEAMKMMKASDTIKETKAINNSSTGFIDMFYVIWNVSAFFCSVFFYSILRCIWHFGWTIYKFHFGVTVPFFTKLCRRLHIISSDDNSIIIQQSQPIPDVVKNSTKAVRTPRGSERRDCEVLYKNSSFSESAREQFNSAMKALNECRRGNYDLTDKCKQLENENKELRTTVQELNDIKDKFDKTSALLRSATKGYKELNHVKMSLELSLKDMKKERDFLDERLKKLEEDNKRLKESLEQIVERDEEMQETQNSKNLQKKILELQFNLDHFHPPKPNCCNKNVQIDLEVAQNTNNSQLINYLKDRQKMVATPGDNDTLASSASETTTNVSSEDNETPCRMISSSAAFQDFMRKLNSSHSYYQRNAF